MINIIFLINVIFVYLIRRSESPLPPQALPTSANPYRLGVGGAAGSGKRPVYSQNVPPPSSFTQVPPIAPPTAPPTMGASLPSSQAPPTSYQPSPTFSQSPPTSSQAPPLTVDRPSVMPVQAHWFYLRDGQEYWYPLSLIDSSKLEETFIRLETDPSYNVS